MQVKVLAKTVSKFALKLSKMRPATKIIIMVGFLVVSMGLVLSIWYAYSSNATKNYKSAIDKADEVLASGGSAEYNNAAQELGRQTESFSTNAQKEAGYRKTAVLYDGKGDFENALKYFLLAEGIAKTQDLGQILRIAFIATSQGNTNVAIEYYEAAQSLYNKSPQTYTPEQTAFVKQIPDRINQLKAIQP